MNDLELENELEIMRQRIDALQRQVDGGGFGGDGWLPDVVRLGGASGGAFAFDGEKVAKGAVIVGRAFVPVAEKTLTEDFTGFVYLDVPMTTQGTPTLQEGQTVPSNTSQNAYVTLYEFKDGDVEIDYRGIPTVTAYE